MLRATVIDASDAAPARRADRETSARADDHRALRLWLRLLTCTQLLERHMRNLLRMRFATTLPRFDLMSRLERYPGGLKMKELSHHLMVTGGSVTGIVDQLVNEKLAERLRSGPGVSIAAAKVLRSVPIPRV